jgi:ppGpp synthetase/RelA/SpoT-type nucleotidyltranferase
MLKDAADMILEIKDVVTANGLSMNDSERMNIINYVYDRLRSHRNLVDYYTRKNISISYLRAKKAGDSDRVVKLYGNVNDRYW